MLCFIFANKTNTLKPDNYVCTWPIYDLTDIAEKWVWTFVTKQIYEFETNSQNAIRIFPLQYKLTNMD